MCGLFGVVNYGGAKPDVVNNLVSCLGRKSEIRGTGAGGVAFFGMKKKHLMIGKTAGRFSTLPLASYELHESPIIMGHTRATTQGVATKNANNHPFPSALGRFTFAHNGILNNDHLLKAEHKLTYDIDTDSYVFVSLLDNLHNGVVSFDTLKNVSEKISGTFNFTLLDNKRKLWIVRHNNPLYILKIHDLGVIAYASTKDIMLQALDEYFGGISDYLITRTGKAPFGQEITTKSGDLVCIDVNGKLTYSTFTPMADVVWYYPSVTGKNWSYDLDDYNYTDTSDYLKDMNNKYYSCGYDEKKSSTKKSCLFDKLPYRLVGINYINPQSKILDFAIITDASWKELLGGGKIDVYSHLWGTILSVKSEDIHSVCLDAKEVYTNMNKYSDVFVGGETKFINVARKWANEVCTTPTTNWLDHINESIKSLDKQDRFKMNMLLNRIILDYYSAKDYSEYVIEFQNIIYTLYALKDETERAVLLVSIMDEHLSNW